MPTWNTKLAAIEHARSDYPNAFLLGPAKARRSLLGDLITARPSSKIFPTRNETRIETPDFHVAATSLIRK